MKVVLYVLAILTATYGFPGQIDEVIILPGLRIQPTFKHYSGYLNGSETRKLHYWFVASQNNSNPDPLVLWMNGGPGCSSLDGLLTEHGPFIIQNGGYLNYNNYSWNKIANIIYLESPACVGFSYSTDGKCDASDDSTSLLNYNSLKHFFIKFPQFKGRDFYISGESYGGIYVPTLAERIIMSKEVPYIKLKGIIIGNAYSSSTINWNGNLHFAYNHGLISDSLWKAIITICCSNIDPLHCDITGSQNTTCIDKVNFAKNIFNNINPYNIYSACLTSSTEQNNHLWEKLNISSKYDRVRITMGLINENEKYLLANRQKYLILNSLHKLFGYESLRNNIPCMPDSMVANFLNMDRVRIALHIPKYLPTWSVCSSTIKYEQFYKNMDRQYNTLFNLKDFKIWLYNGDVDMMCSYLSEEWYFEHFNRTVTKIRSQWMYTDDNNSVQVGGFVKIWDKFLLLTVRGAGHMVPTDMPIPAYHMFESFIKGKSL